MKKFTPILLLFILQTDALFCQVDTIPPVLIGHPPTTLISLVCIAPVYVIDLIDSLSDDQTPIGSIEIGMRKICTGEGFPEGIYQLELQPFELAQIEVWARDLAGNTSMTTVSVFYNPPTCDPAYHMSATMPNLPNAYSNGIHDVDFHVTSQNCLQDTFDQHYNSYHYGYSFNNGYAYPFGHNSKTVASKNLNPLNGVTTNDLVLISKHILGIEPFDSPYKIIAADASGDGNVTIYDVVILRKLILGITDTLPGGDSWRFIPKDYVFPNPGNPFSPAYPTQITATPDYLLNQFEFIGVKIGDVNFSADPTQ